MKYALIGCGRIAVNHIKAAVNNSFDIIAVCDIAENKMSELLTKCSVENFGDIEQYTDYKKMLEEHKEIELVSIATRIACSHCFILY